VPNANILKCLNRNGSGTFVYTSSYIRLWTGRNERIPFSRDSSLISLGFNPNAREEKRKSSTMIGPDLNGPLCLKRMWAWSTESEPCALPGVGTLIGAHRVGGGKAVIARVCISPREEAHGVARQIVFHQM
jgi:hypothetical protein